MEMWHWILGFLILNMFVVFLRCHILNKDNNFPVISYFLVLYLSSLLILEIVNMFEIANMFARYWYICLV